MLKKYFVPLTLIVIISLLGFAFFKNNPSTSSNQSGNHKILVSVLPQQQIVERIAGNGFTVTALIPPGFNPATYEPTTADVRNISQSDIYFRIGQITFEKTNLEKIKSANNELLIVDTSVNNTLRNLEAHTHEGEEDSQLTTQNSQLEEIDPHVWLAPKMVKQQAEVIYQTLIKEYPDYANQFETNYQQLVTDLNQLDADLAQAFAPIQGKTILVYHPAFGYLADAYGFHQEYIEIEGKEPSITDLQNIITEAKADGVKVIFVQKQFSTSSAQALADNIGGTVVAIDPLDPNYFDNMRNLANTISSSLIN